MKQLLLVLLPLAMAASSCGQDDSFPFWPEMPGDMPGGQQAVADLKDPDLKWSADSFEATLGAQNSYPTLTNTYGVTITYSSSHPEVATVDGSGVVTALSGGSTLISASSTADGTYSASSASYILTVLGGAGNETGSDALSFASTGDPGSDDDISTTAFKGKITVTFSQTGDAAVTGDTYGYVTVDGNKVTVNNTGGEVLIYELTGTTSNGYVKVYGAKKQAIVLNGASITNPDGAALNNQNKKRTFIVVKGTNTLSDGAAAAYAAEG